MRSYYTPLGKAFLEHRKKYGLTIRELSKIVCLHESYIGDLESLVSAALTVQSYIQSGELDASTAYEISTINCHRLTSDAVCTFSDSYIAYNPSLSSYTRI